MNPGPEVTGAFRAINPSFFSASQKASGIATVMDCTFAFTCSGVLAPGMTEETTEGAAASWGASAQWGGMPCFSLGVSV